MRTPYPAGSRVHRVGRPDEVGTVQAHRLIRDAVEYRVAFPQSGESWYPEEALEPIPTYPPKWINRAALLRNLGILKMGGGFTDIFYSYLASKTEVEPYQFAPAKKFLESNTHRLLIADEVGLGKTIEAGIIFLEMKARQEMKRVLVVCPSRLRNKWRSEFRERFNVSLEDLKKPAFVDFLEKYSEYGDAVGVSGVIAMETIRDQNVRTRMEEVGVTFDMIIVDEAHHMRNSSSEIHKTGLALSQVTDCMLMLSATPININQADLYHLLHILDGGSFPDRQTLENMLEPATVLNACMGSLRGQKTAQAEALQQLNQLPRSSLGREIARNPLYDDIQRRLDSSQLLNPNDTVSIRRKLSALSPLSNHINRTRKREVQGGVMREASILRVPMTKTEINLYSTLLDYARASYRSDGKSPPGFVLVTRERQIASCLRAAVDVLVQGNFKEEEDNYEGDESDIDETPFETARPLDTPRSLRMRINNLANKIGSDDSKLEKFLHSLKILYDENPSTKVLVFSSYLATLRYLEQRLQRETSWIAGGIHRLDGSKAMDDRPGLIREFQNSSGFAVMLMSEVGAEGLDFQFTNVLFNYDLPWNPMKVEQRIGRIDRYGQREKKIKVYSFVIADTIEERILQRLYERVGVFERSIGELEPILGDIIEKLYRDIFQNTLSPAQEQELASQLERTLAEREQHRKELDQLEQQLMGQDILLGSEQNSGIAQGKYLGAEELRAIFESGLENYNVKLVDKGSGKFFLHSHPVFREDINRFLETNKYPNDLRVKLLSGLDNGLPVTFEGSIRDERGLVHLLNFDHPLIRFAMQRISEEKQGLHNMGLATIETAHWPPGQYPFFIYKMDIHSAETRSELVTLVLDRQTHKPIDGLSDSLLSDIQQIKEWEGKFPMDALQAMRNYQRSADDVMFDKRNTAGNAVRERNDRIIDMQRASLQRTHDVHSQRLQEQLRTATEPRIQRMRQAQIDNADAILNRKLQELDQRRLVTVSYDLRLQGWIRARPPQSQSQ